jgi:GcrA cell cycle regulator
VKLSAAEVRERLEACVSRSRSLDLLFRIWQARCDGVPIERIAEELDIALTTTKDVVHRLLDAGVLGPRLVEWTPDKVAQFRTLWNEGHSIAEIARRMEITENAAIGKSHRLIAQDVIAARPRHAGNLSPEAKARRRAAAQPPDLIYEKKLADQRRRRRAKATEKRPRPELSEAEREQRRAAAAARWEQPARPAKVERTQRRAATAHREQPVKRLTPAALNRPLNAVRVHPPYVAPPPPKYGRVAQCCWPIGEPGKPSFHFCDKPTDPGRPYCHTHVTKAYARVSVDERREARA